MSQALEQVAEEISARFAGKVARVPSRCGELTFEVLPTALVELCTALRDEPAWRFEQLIDLAGVDYLEYGRTEWNTQTATSSGFSRGVNRGVMSRAMGEVADVPVGGEPLVAPSPSLPDAVGYGPDDATTQRFAVVYHLLSVTHNRRVRLRTWCEPGEPPLLDSVVEIWKAADWFEREAFDLFGILFRGHPDLRRILTDYGFIGHPFRKDFPLIGNVEVRYDPLKGRVVYEPVSIEPRTLVPRVIRDDNRYAPALKDAPKHG
jgi:NADH-quinone oxidoreductase subunit C